MLLREEEEEACRVVLCCVRVRKGARRVGLRV